MSLESTVAQVLAWIASVGVAWLVSFALAQFPSIPEKAKLFVQTVAVATLGAFVTAVGSFIPVEFLDDTVFQVIVFAVGLLVNGVASRLGTIRGSFALIDTRYYKAELAPEEDAPADEDPPDGMSA